MNSRGILVRIAVLWTGVYSYYAVHVCLCVGCCSMLKGSLIKQLQIEYKVASSLSWEAWGRGYAQARPS